MIGVRQIIENRKIYREDAHSGTANSQRRHDPMDEREGCPTKAEQSDRQESTLDATKVKPSFRGRRDFAEMPSYFLLVDAKDGR